MSWVQNLAVFAASLLTDREREALLSRGVSNEQIDEFQIGYLNKDLPTGMPGHFLEWSEGGQKLNDVFVFPLTTTLGEIRGFQFRHVTRGRKEYMDFFLDRHEPCLFGLHQAIEAIWAAKAVYLVEGVFDLMPIQRAVPYVLATLTAYTNNQTARLLRRLVRRVWLGYDMDAGGEKGHKVFQKKHGDEFEVYIVEYPKVNGKQMNDPGDLWEAWGDARLIPFICSAIERENPF